MTYLQPGKRGYRWSLFLLLIPPLVCWGLGSAAAPHPFYVSVTEIIHKPETQTLQVMVKIFTDDLERALRQAGAKDLRLSIGEPNPQAETYLARYLAQHLTLKLDGKRVALEYLGQEVNLEATWCYLEAQEIPAFEEVTIRHTSLIEVFDNQRNMVHVQAYGQTLSTLLEAGRLSDVLAFD